MIFYYKVYYNNKFMNLSINGPQDFAKEKFNNFIERVIKFEKRVKWNIELFELRKVSENDYND